MDTITIKKCEYDNLIKENKMLQRLLALHEQQKELIKEIELMKRLIKLNTF